VFKNTEDIFEEHFNVHITDSIFLFDFIMLHNLYLISVKCSVLDLRHRILIMYV
jgi:hypothetical protein